MIISIDFDNVIAYDNYPKIGELLPYAKDVIKYLYGRGHEIIINSCRNGEYEKQMRGFLKYHEIPYSWINRNSPRMIRKYGSDTRKISCDIQIDDRDFFLTNNMFIMGMQPVLNNLWPTIDQGMSYLERPLIICIVGESGAGKTMASEYFRYEYGVNMIESYTDRPKRESNERGHKFISPTNMDKIWEREMLACTEWNGYRYCCLADDVERVCTYVIDEHGLKMLMDKYWDKFDIYSIRIHRDKSKRIESVGEDRVNRDEGKFNMKDSEFDYVIHNETDSKEDVFSAIREFVDKFRFLNRFEEYLPLIIDEDGED